MMATFRSSVSDHQAVLQQRLNPTGMEPAISTGVTIAAIVLRSDSELDGEYVSNSGARVPVVFNRARWNAIRSGAQLNLLAQ